MITADSAKYVRPMESASIDTYTSGAQCHWMMVHRIAFSPNGKQLAAMIESEDGESIQIRLYGVGGPLKRIAEFGDDIPRRNGEYAGQSNMLAAWNGFHAARGGDVFFPSDGTELMVGSQGSDDGWAIKIDPLPELYDRHDLYPEERYSDDQAIFPFLFSRSLSSLLPTVCTDYIPLLPRPLS